MTESKSDSVLTQELVKMAQDGDRTAVEELFRRYLPRVRRIVSLRLGKTLAQFDEIEDVVQESLIRVFTGLEKFEARSEASFRSWLSRCVQSGISDFYRRAHAARRGGGNVVKTAELRDGSILTTAVFRDRKQPRPSEVARGHELEERIEQALLSLPEHQRELIVLRRICEMPYAEMASELGFEHENTVRQAVARAVRKLEALLEEDSVGDR